MRASFCSSCGAKISTEARFCTGCGNPIRDVGEVSQREGAYVHQNMSPPQSASPSPAEQGRSLYAEGIQLIANGRKREGLQRFIDAVKVDHRCVEAHIALASAFYMIDPVTHSEHILYSANAALSVDPANGKARNIASVTNFALGKHAWDAENWEQAVTSFREAYRLDSEAEHTAEALAHCAEQAGALEGVIHTFEQNLATNPADLRARYLAGRSYIKLAMSDNSTMTAMTREEALQRGEDHLKKFLKSSPDHPDANYWLGGAYLMSSRDAEAQAIIDLLRSIDPAKSAELEELCN